MVVKTDRDRLVTYNGEKHFITTFHCNECKFSFFSDLTPKFCPNCGKESKEVEDISL